jgi:hypothetical protein
MPQPDPNIPDSVVLGMFEGLRNTVAPERLKANELAEGNQCRHR